MNERYKIKLFQQHFAYIDSNLLREFQYKTGIINIISFIKESAYHDFDIYLENEKSLKTFEKALKKYYYKDKSEWLREKIRNRLIKEAKGE